MINTAKDIVNMIVAILPFVALCYASQRVNLPKSYRAKQFFMPVYAVLFSVLAMFLAKEVDGWLLKLVESLPNIVSLPSKISWLPEVAKAVFTQISAYIRAFIQKLNLNFWIFFLTNVVIMSVYLASKKVVLKIIDKTVSYDSVAFEKIATRFYEFFPERSKWCLADRFVQTRGLLGILYYVAVSLSVGIMLVSQEYYSEGVMKALFYPVFGVLVIGELFFYLDGLTKREYSKDVVGEDEEVYRTVNYSLLRKFFRSILGDSLLAENTSVNSSLGYDITTDDIIRELEKDEDPKTVTYSSYLKMLNKSGFNIDHNYLYSSLDLLKGKSVLFNNPFYNDLIPYAFYPMNRVLLSNKKVLVILGRHAVENDITEWLRKGIESVTNVPYMWNIEVLGTESKNPHIGIITRSDVLNIDLHNANSDFFEDVGYVVIIEPSKLVSTAQIGLNLIVKKCRHNEDKEIVYCMCDKNCDGLVDALSHILMESITEVSATNKHLGTSSYMCWEPNEEYTHHRFLPNISRYLGFGTELSFGALKNQVSKTKWFGGEVFPVSDMHWIAKQYYYDLTKYAGLSTSQEVMDERFLTSPNFWSATAEKNSYITVEDEANNMFEVLRTFSTRTTEQGFVNIISSDYLLKHYMADNASIFEADAKAIPYIVADYTRSNRNTLLRLILMMSTNPVSEEMLEKELSLLNISVFDLKKQLWYEMYNCYAKVTEVATLPGDYKEAVEEAFKREIIGDGYRINADVFETVEKFNLKKGCTETTYAINDKSFLRACVTELRSAGYIVEDEKGGKHYLGAELSGHIYQRHLPGQFFTFDGKYYEMMYLTADGQALVRRASDHINGRPSYRQKREYIIAGVRPSDKIGSQKNISGMKVYREYADITVNTDGYYNMKRYNDFVTANEIIFEGENEKNKIPSRSYRNKEILRIELPAFEGKYNDTIRYTVAVLFNEVFKTIFAENQAFICAVTDDSFIAENEKIKPNTFTVKGDDCEINSNCIYIIEDSQLDMGLLISVERNLQRIFNIIYDYLTWHSEKLEEILDPQPDPDPGIIFTDDDPQEPESKKKKKKGLIRRLIDKLKSLFGKKRKKGKDDSEGDGTTPEPTPEGDEGDGTTQEPTPEGDEGDGTEPEPTLEGDGTEPKPTPEGDEGNGTEPEPAYESDEGSELIEPETKNMPVSDETKKKDPSAENKEGLKFERKPYNESYYLLFGGDSELSCVDPIGTLNYLKGLGLDKNPLRQAREGKKIAQQIEATFKPGKPDARYCDFCGAEIFGVEFETLSDGRDRCYNCGRTAIKTEKEFREIFEDVKRNMESFFGIKLNVGIRVEMVNSRTLHKRLNETFIPTKEFDGRVLGVAIEDKNGFTIMVENGSPRMASMLTIAHELTHIWQYINWNKKAIIKKYGKKMRLQIYEGMAKWAEIQYAYLINEPAVAKREEIITSHRTDEYGIGFLRYRANYPFSTGTVITKATPFMNVHTPLDPQYCTAFVYIDPNAKVPTGEDEGDGHGGNGGNGGNGIIPGGGKEPIRGSIERNPGNVPLYAYQHLSDSEKAMYDVIVDAVYNHKPDIKSIPLQIHKDNMQKIIDYIDRDHPELIWFNRGISYLFDSSSGIVSELNFTYCLTEEESSKRHQEIEASLKPFMDTVTDKMSDYELVLRIYENIIRLVDYDTIGLERQKKYSPVTSDKPDDLRSIYGVFVNKKAVCAGYAKATQYLLNLCGIECVYVTSDTHAWNLVKLEGAYYHLDTTWGDLSNTKKEKNISDRIQYDCFCITTAEVLNLEYHQPESDLPLPECTATKCNYFHRHGLFFEKYNYEKVKAIVAKSFENGVFDISIKFADKKVLSEAERDLVTNSKIREAAQSVSLKTGVRVNLSYSYSVQKDSLILTFHFAKL